MWCNATLLYANGELRTLGVALILTANTLKRNYVRAQLSYNRVLSKLIIVFGDLRRGSVIGNLNVLAFRLELDQFIYKKDTLKTRCKIFFL